MSFQSGAICPNTKDLAEQGEFLGSRETEYAERFIRPCEGDPHSFESIADIERDVFSKSDLEALEYAWEKYGRLEGFRLAELTHAYPEWRRHQAAIESGEATRLPMAYDDFLKDPPGGVEPCFALTESDRIDRREMLAEVRAFERQWS